MKLLKIFKCSMFLACIILFLSFDSIAQNPKDLSGIWVGTMEINENVQMTVGFEFTNSIETRLEGMLHSIDQGSYDMPITNITVEGDLVILKVNAINFTYEGIFTDTETLHGTATQGNNSPWKLNMQKVDALPKAKPKRPQEPVKPYPYFVEEVSFENKAEGITLAGTLTKPKNGNIFPAVVLLSGSGPTDRDATIFGHKFFLVLADQLTRAGYAVLRTDDRGVGESTGNFQIATVEDLAGDAMAAVGYLKTRKDIDKNHIGLLGHSLGAEKASIAASLNDDIKFLVLMAGGAIPLYQGIYEQTKAYYSTQVSDEAVALNTRVLQSVFETIKDEPNNEKAKQLISEKLKLLDDEVLKLTMEEQKFLNLTTPLSVEKFNFFMSPAMRFDLFFDPLVALEKVKAPVLAINGALDLQVLPHNLEGIEKALIRGGNSNYKIHLFENKNHMFQDAITGTPEEYTEIETTIARDVLECVIAWIEDKTKS